MIWGILWTIGLDCAAFEDMVGVSAGSRVTSAGGAEMIGATYHLWYADGGLYLIGHCHLRQDVRMFAVDRIRSLTLTNRPCQMPLDFDLDAYVRDALVVMRGKPIEVELLFDKPTSAWVKDRQWHPSQKTTIRKDGRLAMSLRASDTRELVGWVLHFGSGVQVVGPASFRDKVREEAQKISEQQ